MDTALSFIPPDEPPASDQKNQAAALVSPINRLPETVLESIFTLGFPPAYTADHPSVCKNRMYLESTIIRVISSVCRTWRQVVISYPHFWAHPCFRRPVDDQKHLRFDHRSWLDIVITRSQSAPIKVYVSSESWKYLQGPQEDALTASELESAASSLRFLGSTMDRWAHAFLEGPLLPGITTYFPPAPGRFPLLGQLHLRPGDDSPLDPDPHYSGMLGGWQGWAVEGAGFDCAPKLTHIKLSGCMRTSLSTLRLPWHQLTTLIITLACQTTTPHILHILSVTSLLVHLTLESAQAFHLPSAESALTGDVQVVLPRLRSLHLGIPDDHWPPYRRGVHIAHLSHGFHFFSRSLHLPALEEASWDYSLIRVGPVVHGRMIEDFATLLRTSTMGISTLRLSIGFEDCGDDLPYPGRRLPAPFASLVSSMLPTLCSFTLEVRELDWDDWSTIINLHRPGTVIDDVLQALSSPSRNHESNSDHGTGLHEIHLHGGATLRPQLLSKLVQSELQANGAPPSQRLLHLKDVWFFEEEPKDALEIKSNFMEVVDDLSLDDDPPDYYTQEMKEFLSLLKHQEHVDVSMEECKVAKHQARALS